MDNSLYEPLIKAISNGRTDVLRSLLFSYEKVHHQNLLNADIPQHGTLLHYAVKQDEVDSARALLSLGADPSLPNGDGATPLQLVASKRMTTVFAEELLRASAQSQLSRVTGLLDAGINVNLRDSSSAQNTPLHWAASFGTKDTLQLLIERGAEVNSTNSQGATPLHDAVHRGDGQLVQALLEEGASPHVSAVQGKFAGMTPMDLARNQPELLSLFQRYSKIDGVALDGKGDSFDKSLESLATETDLTLSASKLSLISTDSPPPSKQAATSLCPELQLLWPKPQVLAVERGGSTFTLTSPGDLRVAVLQPVTPPEHLRKAVEVWEAHRAALASSLSLQLCCEVHTSSPGPHHVACSVNPALFSRSQAYRLLVTSSQVKLLASDGAALHYGICTLLQVLKSCKCALPLIQVEDWPSLSHRGISLDLSLNSRVPRMESLEDIVTKLSRLKFNQLHLHFTLGSRGEWPTYFSKRELMELESHCQGCHVEVVPSFDLVPNVAFTVKHLATLVDVASSFPSARALHLGSHVPPQEVGQFLSHHTLICSAAAPFCPRVVNLSTQNDDELTELCQEVLKSGESLILSAGTLTNNCLAGQPAQSTANMFRVAQTARVLTHCLGFIALVHPGSVPHHAPFCFNWPPLLAAAGIAWNLDTPWELLQGRQRELVSVQLADIHPDHQLLLELGGWEHQLGSPSLPYQLLSAPDSVDVEPLCVPGLLSKTMQQLKAVQPQSADVSLSQQLLVLALRLGRLLMMTGLKPQPGDLGVVSINVGVANLPRTLCTDLANKLLGLTEEYKRVWKDEALSPGLETSLESFSSLLRALVPSLTPPNC